MMMAAISRPSVRSTLQRGASLEKLSATATQQNPSETTRLTKRKRDTSEDHGSLDFTKKRRVQQQSQVPTPPKSIFRTSTQKSPLEPQATALKDSVTQTTQTEQPHIRVTLQPTVAQDPFCVTNDTPFAITANVLAEEPLRSVKKEEKRTLRSQAGGSRSKSELALYFANYDDVVSNEPKEPEHLTPATRIHIVDELSSSIESSPLKAILPKDVQKGQPSSSLRPSFTRDISQELISTASSEHLVLNDAQCIEFPIIDYDSGAEHQDPLADELYAKHHRRAERSEKQLRNIEKERAMHEKVQLERLLEGLKGHDWLKIMGVSGVTDGGKKTWEPKREYFIQEVEALLEKFKEWKEEEKRRKAERGERLLADEMDESEPPSKSGTPDYSDVDAWAARQLHQETITATGRRKRNNKGKPQNPGPPHVEKPFTSFYSKPYLREAALGKHRRGRTRFAFGQPLPAFQDKDFDLPESLLSHDALAASARSRRRARRESKV